MAYMRLGDLLIASGVITQEQLDKALAVQKETHQRLGDVLMQNGFITERNLIDALQIQLGVEFVDLTAVSIPVELARYVPRNIARKFCVVPVKLVQDTLYLAMSDPLDFVAQEQVKAASRKKVIPMIATRQATEQAIARLYGNEGTARVIEEMKREAGTAAPDIVPYLYPDDPLYRRLIRTSVETWIETYGPCRHFSAAPPSEHHIATDIEDFININVNFAKYTYQAIREAVPDARFFFDGWGVRANAALHLDHAGGHGALCGRAAGGGVLPGPVAQPQGIGVHLPGAHVPGQELRPPAPGKVHPGAHQRVWRRRPPARVL